MGRSTFWIILIVFPQTFSLRAKKLYCMCLRTPKQWSRWSLKEGVPTNETCFQDSQSWLFWSNQFGPQNPNQIYWQQKPTRWHFNQRKFHTWWVESFVVLVQYSPFQFYSVALIQWRNDLQHDSERRASHSKIEIYDESYCQDTVVRIVFNFSKLGEETLRKSGSMEINWRWR